MKAKEFDKKLDEAKEDLSQFLDVSKARRAMIVVSASPADGDTGVMPVGCTGMTKRLLSRPGYGKFTAYYPILVYRENACSKQSLGRGMTQPKT